MRIPHGHPDVFVSKQFLHSADVHAAHHKMTGKGVPQIMEPDVGYSSSFNSVLEPCLHLMELLSPLMLEYVRGIQPARDFPQDLSECIIYRDRPTLVVLRVVIFLVVHTNDPPLEVDVLPFQCS